MRLAANSQTNEWAHLDDDWEAGGWQQNSGICQLCMRCLHVWLHLGNSRIRVCDHCIDRSSG
eukprot:5290074-Karenia_brevis.AAC.1